MKLKKLLSLCLAGALSVCALAGCSQGEQQSPSQPESSSSAQVQQTETSGVEKEATQLLEDIDGTYQELFPVIFDAQYDQLWLDDSAAIVGEAGAPEAVDMLKGSVSGTLHGQEAVGSYGEEGGAFFCGWLDGVSKLTVDGGDKRISGADENGTELFSHTYHFAKMDGDLFVYESDDADSGDFAYFAFLPDTPDSTYHIEFRYGSTDTDMGEWMAGPYAYWMAAGIPIDHSQSLIEDCVKLFCDENLAEQ